VGGVPIFFYFHIWTTEVIPYNALNSELATQVAKNHLSFALQQHFFNIFEPNKGTKEPENHSLD
jgi:hypothetical protein